MTGVTAIVLLGKAERLFAALAVDLAEYFFAALRVDVAFLAALFFAIFDHSP